MRTCKAPATALRRGPARQTLTNLRVAKLGAPKRAALAEAEAQLGAVRPERGFPESNPTRARALL